MCSFVKADTCFSMTQGDDRDSSDEEWEEHIGRHARAFLGLDEPVREIPLDEGVGIGVMVRNALARADDVHMRAFEAAQASSDAAEVSTADTLHSGSQSQHEVSRLHRKFFFCLIFFATKLKEPIAERIKYSATTASQPRGKRKRSLSETVGVVHTT